jgi:hypothetical protein
MTTAGPHTGPTEIRFCIGAQETSVFLSKPDDRFGSDEKSKSWLEVLLLCHSADNFANQAIGWVTGR